MALHGSLHLDCRLTCLLSRKISSVVCYYVKRFFLSFGSMDLCVCVLVLLFLVEWTSVFKGVLQWTFHSTFTRHYSN